MEQVLIKDVLTNYKLVRTCSKEQISELTKDLSKENIELMSEIEKYNATKFLLSVPLRDLVDYILYMLDSPGIDFDSIHITKFLGQFELTLSSIYLRLISSSVISSMALIVTSIPFLAY